MRDQDAIQMMRRCAEEIRCLRRANNELAPKAEAYDTIRSITGLLPGPSIGHSEDLVWRLEKEIASLESQDQPTPADDVVPE